MDFRFRALLACVVSVLLLALTPSAPAANPQVPVPTRVAQLRPGDSLVVSLQGIPDPSNNQVQISDNETISLPYIGPISTADASSDQLAQRIRETYIAKKFYITLDVSVSVTERYIYVGGEVTRPGRIIWTPDLTVAKAVQAAGGFTLYAKETAVSLVRERKAYDINVNLAQKNPEQDVPLMPGDSVQVPRSRF
jgi:polysaccharide export outer membrane protein